MAPQQTTCTPTDLFLYCYYGGMVCIGRRWQGAWAMYCAIQRRAGGAQVARTYRLQAFQQQGCVGITARAGVLVEDLLADGHAQVGNVLAAGPGAVLKERTG